MTLHDLHRLVLAVVEERWISPVAPEYRHMCAAMVPIPTRLAADVAGVACEPRSAHAHYWSLVGATMRYAGDERQSAHFVGYMNDAAAMLYKEPLHHVEPLGRTYALQVLAVTPQLFKGQKVNPIALGAKVGRRRQYGEDHAP